MAKWLRNTVRQIRYILDCPHLYPVILIGRARDFDVEQLPPGYAVVFVDGNKIELLK
jgi:hypothetical protein